MINRICKPLLSNSFFLFGARGTGKSTFLKQLPPLCTSHVLWIDLLDPKQEDSLAKNPSHLNEILNAKNAQTYEWVVIDEVQKVPALLDVVHHQIEEKKLKFALTGSSARKLKKGAANLLAGRAFMNHLYPFTYLELGEKFQLKDVLQWGGLPKIFSLESDIEKVEYLDSYVHIYLKEEIVSEQIVRKVQPFRAFLEVAAQTSGKIINYSKIARDIGSDAVSVQSYFEILEDTLIGFQLKPFHESIRKRQRKNPKFYLFDLGVKRALERQLTLPIQPQTYGFGDLFEHFVITEMVRLNSYFRKKWDFSYLRTKDDAEIDLILDRPGMPKAVIEIKSTTNIREDDLRSFSKISSVFDKAQVFCFSNDPVSKKIGNVECLHWQKGFEALGLLDSN